MATVAPAKSGGTNAKPAAVTRGNGIIHYLLFIININLEQWQVRIRNESYRLLLHLCSMRSSLKESITSQFIKVYLIIIRGSIKASAPPVIVPETDVDKLQKEHHLEVQKLTEEKRQLEGIHNYLYSIILECNRNTTKRTRYYRNSKGNIHLTFNE